MYIEKLKRRISIDGKKSALKYANRIAHRVTEEEKAEFEEIHLNLIYSTPSRTGGMVSAMREDLIDLQYEERTSF